MSDVFPTLQTVNIRDNEEVKGASTEEWTSRASVHLSNANVVGPKGATEQSTYPESPRMITCMVSLQKQS